MLKSFRDSEVRFPPYLDGRGVLQALRDRAEAEDVTQETFIRAFQALPRFDGRSEAYTWFYRITINLSLNRIRSRKTSRATVRSLWMQTRIFTIT